MTKTPHDHRPYGDGRLRENDSDVEREDAEARMRSDPGCVVTYPVLSALHLLEGQTKSPVHAETARRARNEIEKLTRELELRKYASQQADARRAERDRLRAALEYTRAALQRIGFRAYNFGDAKAVAINALDTLKNHFADASKMIGAPETNARTQCKACQDSGQIFAGGRPDAHGEVYDQYEPCPSCDYGNNEDEPQRPRLTGLCDACKREWYVSCDPRTDVLVKAFHCPCGHLTVME